MTRNPCPHTFAKHTAPISAKLGLWPPNDDNRCALAVRAYLGR
jgi:hypothetical protein